MATVELSPNQFIEYFEEGNLVAKITSENIDELSPVSRDYIAFIHPYDVRGMFTIPVTDVNIRETDDFRFIGTILRREQQGNSLVFTLKDHKEGKEKKVRIVYHGIDVDEMFRGVSSRPGTEQTGWKLMLNKHYKFPELKEE